MNLDMLYGQDVIKIHLATFILMFVNEKISAKERPGCCMKEAQMQMPRAMSCTSTDLMPP